MDHSGHTHPSGLPCSCKDQLSSQPTSSFISYSELSGFMEYPRPSHQTPDSSVISAFWLHFNQVVGTMLKYNMACHPQMNKLTEWVSQMTVSSDHVLSHMKSSKRIACHTHNSPALTVISQVSEYHCLKHSTDIESVPFIPVTDRRQSDLQYGFDARGQETSKDDSGPSMNSQIPTKDLL